ncbi:alkaline-responsive transcriptional regulator RIM101 PWA37_000564 [Arxiozyma heterogenica]|uniref:C2H2-type domain-containing protein n=1 Tax=Arxiozyma heterogenica TaxID=278026 RepID=A0AAN7WTJ2_9SACH|nr:hypothetical protein RI543_000051 [Kazachstania heterogenica]
MSLQLQDLLNKDSDSAGPLLESDTIASVSSKTTVPSQLQANNNNNVEVVPTLAAGKNFSAIACKKNKTIDISSVLNESDIGQINNNKNDNNATNNRTLITPPGSDVEKASRDEENINYENNKTVDNVKHVKAGKFNTIATNMKVNGNMVNNPILKEPLICQWHKCNLKFYSAALLYHHLCQDHVGRKSQKNLQLNCHWGDCKVKTEKRDHITSHLRVHVPLKPFVCSKCQKFFKRPQDLKKHLKIHLESNIASKKKRGRKLGSKNVVRKQNNATVDSTNLKNFINNDIHSVEPILNSDLRDKLKNILPLPTKVVSTPNQTQDVSTPVPLDFILQQDVLTPQSVTSSISNSEFRNLSNSSSSLSPVSDVRSNITINGLPKANPTLAQNHFNQSTTNTYIPPNSTILHTFDDIPRTYVPAAVTFFTKLSQNMVLQQQQPQKQQQQSVQPVQFISQQQQDPHMSIPQYVHVQQPSSAATSNYPTPGSLNDYGNVEYPVIPQLPPIGQTSIASQPVAYATPAVPAQTTTPTTLQPTSTIVPMATLPVLQPRLHFQMPSSAMAQQLAPQSNNGIYYKHYGVYQMNNGRSEESDDDSSEIDEDEENGSVILLNDDEEDAELLDVVNLVKDYLVCTLLEEDFELDVDERVVEQNNTENMSDIKSLSDKFDKVLKYPKIVL